MAPSSAAPGPATNFCVALQQRNIMDGGLHTLGALRSGIPRSRFNDPNPEAVHYVSRDVIEALERVSQILDEAQHEQSAYDYINSTDVLGPDIHKYRSANNLFMQHFRPPSLSGEMSHAAHSTHQGGSKDPTAGLKTSANGSAAGRMSLTGPDLLAPGDGNGGVSPPPRGQWGHFSYLQQLVDKAERDKPSEEQEQDPATSARRPPVGSKAWADMMREKRAVEHNLRKQAQAKQREEEELRRKKAAVKVIWAYWKRYKKLHVADAFAHFTPNASAGGMTGELGATAGEGDSSSAGSEGEEGQGERGGSGGERRKARRKKKQGGREGREGQQEEVEDGPEQPRRGKSSRRKEKVKGGEEEEEEVAQVGSKVQKAKGGKWLGRGPAEPPPQDSGGSVDSTSRCASREKGRRIEKVEVEEEAGCELTWEQRMGTKKLPGSQLRAALLGGPVVAARRVSKPGSELQLEEVGRHVDVARRVAAAEATLGRLSETAASPPPGDAAESAAPPAPPGEEEGDVDGVFRRVNALLTSSAAAATADSVQQALLQWTDSAEKDAGESPEPAGPSEPGPWRQGPSSLQSAPASPRRKPKSKFSLQRRALCDVVRRACQHRRPEWSRYALPSTPGPSAGCGDDDLLWSRYGWTPSCETQGPWALIDPSILVLVHRVLASAGLAQSQGERQRALQLATQAEELLVACLTEALGQRAAAAAQGEQQATEEAARGGSRQSSRQDARAWLQVKAQGLGARRGDGSGPAAEAEGEQSGGGGGTTARKGEAATAAAALTAIPSPDLPKSPVKSSRPPGVPALALSSFSIASSPVLKPGGSQSSVSSPVYSSQQPQLSDLLLGSCSEVGLGFTPEALALNSVLDARERGDELSGPLSASSPGKAPGVVTSLRLLHTRTQHQRAPLVPLLLGGVSVSSLGASGSGGGGSPSSRGTTSPAGAASHRHQQQEGFSPTPRAQRPKAWVDMSPRQRAAGECSSPGRRILDRQGKGGGGVTPRGSAPAPGQAGARSLPSSPRRQNPARAGGLPPQAAAQEGPGLAWVVTPGVGRSQAVADGRGSGAPWMQNGRSVAAVQLSPYPQYAAAQAVQGAAAAPEYQTELDFGTGRDYRVSNGGGARIWSPDVRGAGWGAPLPGPLASGARPVPVVVPASPPLQGGPAERPVDLNASLRPSNLRSKPDDSSSPIPRTLSLKFIHGASAPLLWGPTSPRPSAAATHWAGAAQDELLGPSPSAEYSAGDGRAAGLMSPRNRDRTRSLNRAPSIGPLCCGSPVLSDGNSDLGDLRVLVTGGAGAELKLPFLNARSTA